MDIEDYYSVFAVSSEASMSEIRKIYHTLMLQCHPDLHPNDELAAEKAKTFNNAAYVLLDTDRRAAYDATYMKQRIVYGESSTRSSDPSVVTQPIQGHNVTCYAYITSSQACTGMLHTLSFHTPDGQPYGIRIQIPAGVMNGAKLCVPEAGSPGLNGGRRGNLYLVVIITQ